MLTIICSLPTSVKYTSTRPAVYTGDMKPRTVNPSSNFHIARQRLYDVGTRIVFRTLPDGTLQSAIRIIVQMA